MSDPYRIRSAETWEAARLAYLAGYSADVVYGRFDPGLSAFRKQAKAEGWHRADPLRLKEARAFGTTLARELLDRHPAPERQTFGHPPARLNALGAGRPIFSPIQRAVLIRASRS